MARSGTLRVRIVGDDAPFRRTIDGMGSRLAGFAKMAGFAGAAAAAAFGVRAVSAASDLNETLQKTEQVFGVATGRVTGFADDMAEAFGTPKQALLDAASNIGLVGKAAGLAEGPASDMAVEMAQLALDASSFFNVPLPEALEKIRSGLVGEAEPLRAFGVLLSEAAVKEEALALGLVGANEQLTEQDKVLARASLITKGMSDASGDLSRTQDSLANRVRELKGRFENFAAAVGERALPFVNDLLDRFENSLPTIDEWGRKIGGWLRDRLDEIRQWWEADGRRTWEAIKDKWDEFVQGVENAWPDVEATFDAFGGIVESVGRIFSTEMENMDRSSEGATGSITDDTESLMGTLRTFAETAETVSGAVSKHWNGLTGAVTMDVDRITRWLDGLSGGTLSRFRERSREFRSDVVAKFRELREGAVQKLEELGDEIRALPGKILQWLSGLPTLLKQKGKQLIQGLKDGVDEKLRSFGSFFADVGSRVLGAFGIGDGYGVGVARGRELGERLRPRVTPGSGAAGLLQFVSGLGIPHRVTSVNRPGARTLSGSRSYHAVGRAIDLVGPNMHALALAFQQIGPMLRELITPFPWLNWHNGRPHRYSSAVQRQHSGSNAHIHAALKDGGFFSKHKPFHGFVSIAEAGQDEIASPVPMLRKIVREEAGAVGFGPVIIQIDGREVARVTAAELRRQGRRGATPLAGAV